MASTLVASLRGALKRVTSTTSPSSNVITRTGQTSQKTGHVHPGTAPDWGKTTVRTGNTSRKQKAPAA
jgi:hypothetical protein